MGSTIDLISGLPRLELIGLIQHHHRQGEIAERALGFYLLEMDRRKAFRPDASSAAEWARKYLSCDRPDKLILLARRLEDLPSTEAAFHKGEIPWTKIREIARVATAANEDEWLDLARKASSRELERATAKAKRGDRPGEGFEARRVKEFVRFPVTPEERVLWEKANRKV